MTNPQRLLALLTLTLGLTAPNSILTAAPASDPIDIGNRPESITRGFKGLYYASVMMGTEPGDAVIKEIDGNQLRVFTRGLDEPKGICFTGRHLVVTDVNKVWKIDAEGGKQLLAGPQDFPVPVSYLNDIASGRNGEVVYVTDMGANTKMFGPDGLWPIDSPEAEAIPVIARVFEIPLKGKPSVLIPPHPLMLNPNGIAVGHEGQLFIAEFFHGNILEWNDGQLHRLTSGLRGADAIEQTADKALLISSWTQGKVWRLRAPWRQPEVVVEGLDSAADFYLDQAGKRLLLPDMKAGKVFTVPL